MAKNVIPFHVRWEDIIKSESMGRWWVVGSSWRDKNDGNENDQDGDLMETLNHKKDDDDDDGNENKGGEIQFDKVAREHGMNTTTRRSIFR